MCKNIRRPRLSVTFTNHSIHQLFHFNIRVKVVAFPLKSIPATFFLDFNISQQTCFLLNLVWNTPGEISWLTVGRGGDCGQCPLINTVQLTLGQYGHTRPRRPLLRQSAGAVSTTDQSETSILSRDSVWTNESGLRQSAGLLSLSWADTDWASECGRKGRILTFKLRSSEERSKQWVMIASNICAEDKCIMITILHSSLSYDQTLHACVCSFHKSNCDINNNLHKSSLVSGNLSHWLLITGHCY